MKKFLIKNVKRENASYDDYYSTFEIPDEELRNKILNYEVDNTTFQYFNEDWKIVAKEDNEYKCQSGKNIKYFDENDVDEMLLQKRNYLINKEFDVDTYFKKLYDVLYNYTESLIRDDYYSKNLIILDLLPLIETVGQSQSIFKTEEDLIKYKNMDLDYILQCHFYQYEYTLSCSKALSLSYKISGCNLSAYFNSDANLFCREYNLPLSNYTQEYVNRKQFMDSFDTHFMNNFNNLVYSPTAKNLMFYNDKFFYLFDYYEDDEKTKYNLKIEAIPLKDGSTDKYQEYKGQPIYKKPTKTKEISTEDALKLIKEKTPQKFLDLFKD